MRKSNNLNLDKLTPIDETELTLNYLNECFDAVKICGHDYLAGDALKEIDPIAFRQEESNYIDSLMNDGEIVSFDNCSTLYWAKEVEELEEESEENTD